MDRLWPRGISKETARIDKWIKDISPTSELRKWYGHESEKWLEFKERYFEELKSKESLIAQIISNYKGRVVTLLFSSKEKKLNSACALKEYIEARIEGA